MHNDIMKNNPPTLDESTSLSDWFCKRAEYYTGRVNELQEQYPDADSFSSDREERKVQALIVYYNTCIEELGACARSVLKYTAK